jgi:hypothetical protein
VSEHPINRTISRGENLWETRTIHSVWNPKQISQNPYIYFNMWEQYSFDLSFLRCSPVVTQRTQSLLLINSPSPAPLKINCYHLPIQCINIDLSFSTSSVHWPPRVPLADLNFYTEQFTFGSEHFLFSPRIMLANW